MKTDNKKTDNRIENQDPTARPTARQRLHLATCTLGCELKALLTLATVTTGAMACLAIVSKTPIIQLIGCNLQLLAVASALYILPAESTRLGIKGTATVYLARSFRTGLRAPFALLPNLTKRATKAHEFWRNLRPGPGGDGGRGAGG